MCRYAFYNYKNTYACFTCQVGFKRRNHYDVEPDLYNRKTKEGEEFGKDAKCPNCGGEMHNIGRDLRLPPKTKKEQWRCIEYLVQKKYNIYSCGCQGIGFVPHKMEDAIALVEEYEGRFLRYQKEEATKLKLEEKAKKKRDLAKERKTKALLLAVKKEHEKDNL
jgi:hypothetical protein